VSDDSLPRSGPLRWLFITVVGSMGLAVALLAISRDLLPAETLQECNDVVGNYLQTLGTIYAVLLAFAVFVVWTQFTETNARLGAEANELFDIMRTSRTLPEELRTKVAKLVRKYVDRVLEAEWHSFRRGDLSSAEEGWHILDSLWDVLSKYRPDDERANLMTAEILARFNDLSDARTARLSSASSRIPVPLRILLYTGAMTVIGSLYLFAVQRFWIHAFIVAATAGAISHVLYVIEDLDDPFWGAWRVTDSPFLRLCDYIDDC
jgi:hypothetical protein